MNDYYFEETIEGYIEVHMPNNLIEKATKRAEENLFDLDRSVTEGEDQHGAAISGCVAEEACMIVIPELDFIDVKDYDFIYGNRTWDCKSLRCKFKPNIKYEMSIYNLSEHQKCDYFILTRTLEETYKKVWILGFMTMRTFWEKSFFRPKGYVREENGRRFTYTDDCHNVYIKDITWRPFSKDKLDEIIGIKFDKGVNKFF